MSVLKAMLASALAATVAACGGGGGVASGGIGGTGISYGPVTGFGSIIVNGVRYNTDAATVTVENGSGLGDLAVGMVVTVRHDTSGTATAVDYRDSVEGPVLSVDPVGNTLDVLGLIVTVDSGTYFEGTTGLAGLDPILAGDIVEVSGLVTATNTVQATRIERRGFDCSALGGAELEVKGTVAGLSGTTFTLGSLTVDFGSAVSVDAFANGDFVEVKGNACPSGGVFTATQVERETDGPDLTDVEDGDELELKGAVSALGGSSPNFQFTLNGATVSTDADTEYEHGSASDLADGVIVEAEGALNAAGVLVAEKIEFEAENDADAEIELRGTAMAVTQTSFNVGTITVLDLAVATDLSTQFRGSTSTTAFNLGTIVAGTTCLEVRAVQSGSGLTATSVEQQSDCSEQELTGPATDVSSPVFNILGILIETDGSTQFRDSDENAISQGAFFAAIAAGTSVVSAEGSYSGGVMIASEVEIED